MLKADLVRIVAVLAVALMVPLTGCIDPGFVQKTDESTRWMGEGLNETGASEKGVEEISGAINHRPL